MIAAATVAVLTQSATSLALPMTVRSIRFTELGSQGQVGVMMCDATAYGISAPAPVTAMMAPSSARLTR